MRLQPWCLAWNKHFTYLLKINTRQQNTAACYAIGSFGFFLAFRTIYNHFWQSQRTVWTANESFATSTPSCSSSEAVPSWGTAPETSSSCPGWCRPSTSVSISNSGADRSSRLCHGECFRHTPECSAARFSWLPWWRATWSTRSAPSCVLVAAEDLAPSQWRRVGRPGALTV